MQVPSPSFTQNTRLVIPYEGLTPSGDTNTAGDKRVSDDSLELSSVPDSEDSLEAQDQDGTGLQIVPLSATMASNYDPAQLDHFQQQQQQLPQQRRARANTAVRQRLVAHFRVVQESTHPKRGRANEAGEVLATRNLVDVMTRDRTPKSWHM